MHKKKNPLRVVTGELVLNFWKGAAPVATNGQIPRSDALALVRDCCRREMVRSCGASTEDLHHAVVPRLLEAGLLASFSREYGDLTPLLEQTFEFERQTGKWHLRRGAEMQVGLPRRMLVRYAVLRHLGACDRAGQPTTEAKTRAYVRSFLPAKKSDASLVRAVLREVGFTKENGHGHAPGRKAAAELSLF